MSQRSHYYLTPIALCTIITSNAATLLVTNLLDDGTPGSLRETIATASGGDTIKFTVTGTILLNEALGELAVDKQLTIDGQYNIAVDGKNQINICFHITGASASNSIIQNITIQNFNGHDVSPGSGAAPQELPAYGILIENGADNCSTIATTITHIHSGVGEQAAGIAIMGYYVLFNATTIINNTITFISSEDNPAGSSGTVYGIFAAANITQDCMGNTIYNLTSGSATNSGDVNGILTGSVTNNCSYNTIYNLKSGNSVGSSGPTIGMFSTAISNNCSFNTLYNLTSGSALTNNSGLIFGIVVGGTIEGACSHNTLYGFTSGTAVGNSGSIAGIVVFTSINGSCSFNTVTNLISGNTSDRAGQIVGIEVFLMSGTCSHNSIKQLIISDTPSGTQTAFGILLGIKIDELRANCINNHIADLSANDSSILREGGILLESINGNHLVACNTVERITGGPGNILLFGIQIEEGDNIAIKDNTINAIVGTSSAAHGILLEDTAGVIFVTNSLLSFNIIHNITGAANNGFGITIAQAGSIGNDLLSNSIFSINGKAINIIDNGVPVDATVTLQSAVCGAQTIFVRGTLEPDAPFEESEFLLQFFSSNQNSPPQTMTFIGEATVQADDTTPFVAEIKSCKPTDSNEYITATATALPPGTEQNNNTSEVSNAISGCNNQTICNLATTTCNLEPAPCPILIRE